MLKALVAAVAVLPIVIACAPTDAQMRAAPVMRWNSERPLNEVVGCLVPSLSARYVADIYGQRERFVATVRTPDREYDVASVATLPDGNPPFIVNVIGDEKGATISALDTTAFPIVNNRSSSIAAGVTPCL